MVQITSIKKGLVIDHIKAGRGIKIFNYLKLSEVKSTVALIMNAQSPRNGRKDIIKLEDCRNINFTVLALLSPGLTINVVQDGVIVEKIRPELPETVKDIIECKNPRCITREEAYVPHDFILVNREEGKYRCVYCDEIIDSSDM